jgi:uncharacterized RDD family membrane protein YckC
VAAGLISAAPVGWDGRDIGGGAGSTAQPPGEVTPATSWQAPSERGREVPGAPGLVFAETAPRFVAFFIDTILLAIIGSVVAAALGYGTTVVTRTPTTTSTFVSVSGAAFTIPLAILSLVYFVFFWTGGRRATIGQRIFNIQVGNAFDGRGLTIDQAVRRWLGLGMAIGLLALIPSMVRAANLIELVWAIVLLFTTVTSPVKQGLHDRFAGSAVVRPAGSGSGAATACLVIVVILIVISIVALVGLALAADEIREILEDAVRSA